MVFLNEQLIRKCNDCRFCRVWQESCMNYLFKKRHLESGLLWRTPSHSPGLYNHWPSLRSHMCPDIQDGWREQKHLKNTAKGGVCVILWNFWKTDWCQRTNGFLFLFIVEDSLDKTASWQLCPVPGRAGGGEGSPCSYPYGPRATLDTAKGSSPQRAHPSPHGSPDPIQIKSLWMGLAQDPDLSPALSCSELFSQGPGPRRQIHCL